MRSLLTSMLLSGALALGWTGPALAQDYTISIDQDPVSVNTGESSLATVTVTGTGGFDGATVALAVSGLPADVSSSIAAAGLPDPAGTKSWTLTISALASALPGAGGSFMISGTGGGLPQHDKTVGLTVVHVDPSFELLGIDPPQIFARSGGSAKATVNTAVHGGFDPATIVYSVTNLPAGGNAAFGPLVPSPVPGEYLREVTVTTAAGTPLAEYDLTVTGTGPGGVLTSSFPLKLFVVTPSFSLAGPASGSTVNILQGGSTGSVLTATWTPDGYEAPISYSAAGLPTGATATFGPYDTPLPPGSFATLMTVAVDVSVSAAIYPFTVTATSPGATTRTLNMFLNVQQGTFTLTASVTSAAVLPGGVATTQVTTVLGGGYASPLDLSLAGIPVGSGITYGFAIFSSDPGTGTAVYDLTITTSAGTPVGTYPLVITGNWASLTRTQPYTLIVANPDFTISATPTTVSVAPGSQATVTVSTLDSGTFNSSVDLSVTGLPAAVTPGFVPATIPSPGTGSSVLTLTADGTVTPGDSFPLTVTGVGGGKSHSTPVTLKIVSAFSVVSIAPNSGPATGGTAVTISGFGFVAEGAVTIGGVATTSVVVVDATTITAVTGANSNSGLADVVVTNPGPVSATLAGGFTYTPPPSYSFYSVTPCRVIDTRTLTVPAMSPLERRNFLVAGSCAVPAQAQAIVLNVTVADTAAAGFLKLFPADLVASPNTSTINFRLGQVKANNAIVNLGADGKLAVENGANGTVDVIVDVVGYFQ